MFNSLEQRMAQSYLDLFPRFIPDEQAEVSVSQQEAFYVFMKELYGLAYREPLLFVPALHEDDAYPNHFNKAAYGKPALMVNQKKYIKAVDALLQNLFALARGEDVKLTKRQKAVFSRLGIEEGGPLPDAMKWMAARPGADVVSFSHCFFRGADSYISEIYASLLGDSAFLHLEKQMLERGYQRYVIGDATGTECKMVLRYANPAWSEEKPGGSFEFKVKHSGITVRYEPWFKEPCIMGVCIPGGMKQYLEHFTEMEAPLKSFVWERTKKCNGCRYCVQADRTGQRPLAGIPVEYGTETVSLCPYFPGYSFCWTKIDEALAEQIVRLLDFMDQFARR